MVSIGQNGGVKMRRAVRVLVVVLLLVAAVAVWKRQELVRLHAVVTLFDAPNIVGNFSHMDRAFVTVPLPRGDGPVFPLPKGAQWTPPQDVADWIAARSVTGIVVLKGGAVVHESYHLGTGPEDRRISWSMAKSYLSMLLGIVRAEDGVLPDLDVQVADVVPGLKGTGYDGVSLRQVLTMTSGVAFNEDYLDFWSDINRMGRTLALGQPMDGFAASLAEREAEPGTRFHYVSIDTHVLGMVIRAATGRPVAELMQERLIGRLGLEADAYYIADGTGEPFVLGGLNMTTRDYARMGQMVLDGGRGIVPADWLAESTRRQAPADMAAMGYGWQWWVPPGQDGGEVMAQGIYGQYVFIDRARGMVVAVNSANRGFKDPGVEDGNIAMLRQIAAAVP
jgi:CubicO group peptidase (beta-lactamase class C family)